MDGRVFGLLFREPGTRYALRARRGKLPRVSPLHVRIPRACSPLASVRG